MGIRGWSGKVGLTGDSARDVVILEAECNRLLYGVAKIYAEQDQVARQRMIRELYEGGEV